MDKPWLKGVLSPGWAVTNGDCRPGRQWNPSCPPDGLLPRLPLCRQWIPPVPPDGPLAPTSPCAACFRLRGQPPARLGRPNLAPQRPRATKVVTAPPLACRPILCRPIPYMACPPSGPPADPASPTVTGIVALLVRSRWLGAPVVNYLQWVDSNRETTSTTPLVTQRGRWPPSLSPGALSDPQHFGLVWLQGKTGLRRLSAAGRPDGRELWLDYQHDWGCRGQGAFPAPATVRVRFQPRHRIPTATQSSSVPFLRRDPGDGKQSSPPRHPPGRSFGSAQISLSQFRGSEGAEGNPVSPP